MKHKKAVIIIISVLAVSFICLGGIYKFFFSMNSLPHGEFLTKSTSPQETFTVNFYIVAPALSADAFRGEVINNNSHKTRNFYWGYREDDPVISWESDNVVVVNGRKLDVTKDTYDWRRE